MFGKIINGRWLDRMTSSWLGQGDFQEKYEGLRGREVQMSTYRLRVLADQRSALLTHPSDSVTMDTFGDDGSGRGRRAAPL